MSAKRSFLLSSAEGYIALVVQMGTGIFLARLLTPTEFGVYASAAVFAAIASRIRDFGVAEYLIQERDLTDTTIRASFAANIIVSWTVAAAMFSLSWPVADFFKEPGVGDVMRVQAVNSLLIPFGAVALAIHHRNMNFGPIFVAGVASTVVSASAVLFLAMRGYGFMSMPWSTLVGTVTSVGLAILLRPKGLPWLPGLKGLRSVLSFGGQMSAVFLIGQLGRSAPEVMTGRAIGMGAVGHLSRAAGLLESFSYLVMRAVTLLSLPYFSSAIRNGGSARDEYLKSQAKLTGVGWPFFLALLVMAEPAIITLYGDQWRTAIPLVQLLCVSSAIDVVNYLSRDLLIANGNVREAVRTQIALQILRVAGFALVFPLGLTAGCLGLVGASIAFMAYVQSVLHRAVGVRLRDVAVACRRSAAVAVLTLLPSGLWHLAHHLTAVAYSTSAIACGVLTAGAWYWALKRCDHPLATDVGSVLAGVRARLGAGRGAGIS